MITLDEALARAATEMDWRIDKHLREFEAKLRRDIAATGPEDEEALDLPPDPESPWRRSSVEEALLLRRQELLTWLAEALAELRKILSEQFNRG